MRGHARLRTCCPPPVNFTFWSCISSPTTCFVTLPYASMQWSTKWLYIPHSKTFNMPKAFAALWAKHKKLQVGHFHSDACCINTFHKFIHVFRSPHQNTMPRWSFCVRFVATPAFSGDARIFIISPWQVTVPAICACGFSLPCSICLAPC